MTYTVIVPKKVRKQLSSLPDKIYARLKTQIAHLADDPRPKGALKLKGLDNSYRIRIGDYRLCYEVKDKELIITLLRCMHRKEVYKDKK
ncbi:MAG: type II toxin-antitoxin system RelE/ParE family toxin [Merismopedia sp. SIO2A8]|nr:type II toxin-antitoxin system RelE/ParE family toxin [Merismopedia sp. SIO2A8]